MLEQRLGLVLGVWELAWARKRCCIYSYRSWKRKHFPTRRNPSLAHQVQFPVLNCHCNRKSQRDIFQVGSRKARRPHSGNHPFYSRLSPGKRSLVGSAVGPVWVPEMVKLLAASAMVWVWVWGTRRLSPQTLLRGCNPTVTPYSIPRHQHRSRSL